MESPEPISPHEVDLEFAAATQAAELDRHTVVGALWRCEGDQVRCLACGHRCRIASGKRGLCRVRFNRNNQLRVPFGYVSGLQCDPIEKKPFFHVLPGSLALTFGMLGCNFHCSFCQNWITSQTLRDAESRAPIQPISSDDIVREGRRRGAQVVVSSYNEPLITAEWAKAVFESARAAGLRCAIVSNGYASPEVLDYLRPVLAAVKIDLKTFNDSNYRALGGTLKRVTDTIRRVHALGLWLEVVTLLIPGFNDGSEELRKLAGFLASVSPNIPWHVTAFHPDFRMTWMRRTHPEDLVLAAQIGVKAGLKFVYAGNLPGLTQEWENTQCPGCRGTLVERTGFSVRACRIGVDGKCPECRTVVPGVWG